MTEDKLKKAIELSEELNNLKIELEAIGNGDIEELSFYFKQPNYPSQRPMVVKVKDYVCSPNKLRLIYKDLLASTVIAMQKEFDEL